MFGLNATNIYIIDQDIEDRKKSAQLPMPGGGVERKGGDSLGGNLTRALLRKEYHGGSQTEVAGSNVPDLEEIRKGIFNKLLVVLPQLGINKESKINSVFEECKKGGSNPTFHLLIIECTICERCKKLNGFYIKGKKCMFCEPELPPSLKKITPIKYVSLIRKTKNEFEKLLLKKIRGTAKLMETELGITWKKVIKYFKSINKSLPYN